MFDYSLQLSKKGSTSKLKISFSYILRKPSQKNQTFKYPSPTDLRSYIQNKNNFYIKSIKTYTHTNKKSVILWWFDMTWRIPTTAKKNEVC